MTEIQSLMLAVCFGWVMGSLLWSVVFLVTEGIRFLRDKKTRRKAKRQQDGVRPDAR